MINHIKKWYKGKQVKVDPDAPDTLGGARVLNEMKTVHHPTAKPVVGIVKLASRFITFAKNSWFNLLMVLLTAIIAVATVVSAIAQFTQSNT